MNRANCFDSDPAHLILARGHPIVVRSPISDLLYAPCF